MTSKLRIAVVEHAAGHSSARRLWNELPDEIKDNDSGMPHIVLYDDPRVATEHFKEASPGDTFWGDQHTLRVVVSVLDHGPKLPRGLFWIKAYKGALLDFVRLLRVSE